MQCIEKWQRVICFYIFQWMKIYLEMAFYPKLPIHTFVPYPYILHYYNKVAI